MSMGSSPSTTTSQIKYTPQQKAAIDTAMPTLLGYLKNPPTIPNTQTVLPFNPLQSQAQSGAVNAAMGPISGFTSGMMNASNFLNFDALSPDTNPWLKGTAEAAIRPIEERLTEGILPNIRATSYTDGFYGGSGQQNAEAMAVRDATREMGATTGKIYSDAFDSGMDRMVKNIALAPQTAQLGMYPWQVLEGVGGQQYARDTAATEDTYNRQLLSQQMPMLAAKDVLSIMMGLGTGSTTTSTPASGGLGSILGGGIGGAATAGALSSLPGLSFLGGPYGIAAGAGLGALASIFN